MIKRVIFGSVLIIAFVTSCKENNTSKDFLKLVLQNLNKIESSTYITTGENWNPGDTAASLISTNFVKEYKNTADTSIGSNFVILDSLTKKKAEFCYDGQMRALLYNDIKEINIDSFKVRKLPFRPLNPPFYNYATSIINYALTTQDSISIEMKEHENYVFVRLTINENEQVEFFGKAFYTPTPPFDIGDPTSIYELWIDKKTNLPFKVRREMSHNITVRTCKNAEFNKLDINDFKASDYFPLDYVIKPYGFKQNSNKKNVLLNHKAPNWTLKALNNQSISLSDFKSKILMIQFTSVSCGPCRASIPFLKNLQNEYEEADFTFVAIESTSDNTNVLKNYMKQNQLNYKFLLSNKQVLKDYFITSFPVFFILDENRVVKAVLNGYGEGTTDKEIRVLINKMIK